jgi:hypothetical protein
VDGDVSLQCEKGDVNVFFSSTGSSTIRAQGGEYRCCCAYIVHIIRLFCFFSCSRVRTGDVKLSVIDTVSVRLNLVGKRVQVAEDAEHFHMETTKKAGIVQVQGKREEYRHERIE